MGKGEEDVKRRFGSRLRLSQQRALVGSSWGAVLRSTDGDRRREFPELFNRPEYRHARVIRLNTPAAADRFLAEASERRSPSD